MRGGEILKINYTALSENINYVIDKIKQSDDYKNQGLIDVLVYQDSYFKQQMEETTDSGTYSEFGAEAKKYYKLQELNQSIISDHTPDENTRRLWASFESNKGTEFKKPSAYYYLEPELYSKVEPETYSYGAPLIMLNKDKLDDIMAENNVLTFEDGKYYNYTDSDGKVFTLRGKNTRIGIPLSDNYSGEYSGEELDRMDRVHTFFSYLSEGADLDYGPYNYTKEETKELLSNVGITSGSFEIIVGNSLHKYILDDNGNVRKDW